jgi:hypothetical protein
MTFTLVPITRTYLDEANAPRTGTVRLQLVGTLYNDGETADRKPVIATLDPEGKISTQFIATNDPGTLPEGGGTVEVTETLSGLPTATYFIAIPYDGGPVDLATAPRLAEATAPGVFFQPFNQRNLPNGYAGLDGSGRVPYSQLPADIGSGGWGGGGTTPISGDDTDIQALGVRAAGASGKAADAQHVHPLPALHEVRKPTVAVDLNGQRIKNAADGVDPQDYATVAQLGQSVLGTINVKDKTYGAKGDGTTDDTAALQAALDDAAPGGIVYVPHGIYRISVPLVLPPAVTLRGSHANLMAGANLTDPPCYIQPLNSFTGSALILLKDQASGGYAALPAEHRIETLMLDASNLDGTKPVDGIFAAGNVQNVQLTDVTIRRMSNNGIVTGGVDNVFPYSWRMRNVMVDNCRANGLLLTRMTDLTMIDSQVIGCWGHGMVLSNIANGQMVACRSEWNGNHGIWITGAWGNGTGSGGMQMTNCSTDRNGYDGVHIDATGNAPISISNLMTRRDGRNGGSGSGGYAGLAVKNATMPVLADAVTCYPGVDDDGTGVPSPDYGISASGSTSVQVNGAYLHGYLGGLLDSGTNTSLVVTPGSTLASGPTTNPVRAVRPLPVDWLNVKVFGAKADGIADDTAQIQAALDAANAAGGHVVYFPAGTYNITAALTVHSNTTLLGDGTNSSIIYQATATAHGIIGTDLSSVVISSIGLTGQPTGSGKGIYFTLNTGPCTLYTTMRDVTVKNFGGDGIDIQQPIVSVFHKVLSQANGGWGFNLHTLADTGPAGTSLQFSACYANGNEVGGYRLHKLTYIQLAGCAADSQTVGYELDYVYGATLDGCGAEDCATSVKINGGGAASVKGMFIYGSRGTGIWVTNGAKQVGIYESNAQGPNGATAFVKTDAGTFVTLANVVGETANSLATGTVNTLTDASGAATFQGALTTKGALTAEGYAYFGGQIEVESNIVSDNGNVVIAGVGKGLVIAEGANARAGVATLVGGTVTVPNTSVTANTHIVLTRQTAGGTLGHLSCTKTAGASFTVDSSSATETSTVFWMLVEPA